MLFFLFDCKGTTFFSHMQIFKRKKMKKCFFLVFFTFFFEKVLHISFIFLFYNIIITHTQSTYFSFKALKHSKCIFYHLTH
jgi:hypothetical protein